MFPILLTLIAVVTAATTQFSDACISAVAQVTADPVTSTCLTYPAIVPLVDAAQKNVSVVQPLNDWLLTVCSKPACSNNTLATVFKLLSNECSSGFASTVKDSFVPTLLDIYPTWRKKMCLKNKYGTLCLTETLTNVEATLRPIATYTKIEDSVSDDLPANVTCTDCIKAQFSFNADIFMGADITSTNSTLRSKCGVSFVDGNVPLSIVEGENIAVSTAVTSLKSSASSVRSSLAIILVLTVSTIIAGSTTMTVVQWWI